MGLVSADGQGFSSAFYHSFPLVIRNNYFSFSKVFPLGKLGGPEKDRGFVSCGGALLFGCGWSRLRTWFGSGGFGCRSS